MNEMYIIYDISKRDNYFVHPARTNKRFLISVIKMTSVTQNVTECCSRYFLTICVLRSVGVYSAIKPDGKYLYSV